METVIEIISNEAFWIGITALASLAAPVAVPYVRIMRKVTNELVELHDATEEDNEAVKARAIDNGLDAAAKHLSKRLK